MSYNELDFNLIKTFVTVYENKSILLASKILYISQPAITNSIKRLEKFLDGPLFIRTPKGVIPTVEANNFFLACKSAIANIDKGVDSFTSFKNLDIGTISIGSSSTIIRKLILPFIIGFNKKYPNIKIKITDADNLILIEQLKRGELDLVILNSPFETSNMFDIIPITHTTDCFVASPDFKKDYLTKEELKDYPLILQKKPSTNRDYFDKLCQKQNIFYTPAFEIGSFGLLTDFVANNMGIGCTIKEFVLDDINDGRIKEIKTNFKIEPRAVAVITTKESFNSNARNFFIKNLIDYFDKDYLTKGKIN